MQLISQSLVSLYKLNYQKNPRFFQQTVFTSFQRQLNLYCFRKISHGSDQGSFYHELFLRGRKDFCRGMVRSKLKGIRQGGQKSSQEMNGEAAAELDCNRVESDNTTQDFDVFSYPILNPKIMQQTFDDLQRCDDPSPVVGNNVSIEPLVTSNAVVKEFELDDNLHKNTLVARYVAEEVHSSNVSDHLDERILVDMGIPDETIERRDLDLQESMFSVIDEDVANFMDQAFMEEDNKLIHEGDDLLQEVSLLESNPFHSGNIQARLGSRTLRLDSFDQIFENITKVTCTSEEHLKHSTATISSPTWSTMTPVFCDGMSTLELAPSPTSVVQIESISTTCNKRDFSTYQSIPDTEVQDATATKRTCCSLSMQQPLIMPLLALMRAR